MAHPLHPFSRNERLMYMANAFSFVFFFSVVTSGLNSYASIALTCFFVVPYKMFLRTLLECSCIYTGAYDDKQEIDDGDNDPLNNNFSYCGCCLEMCGNLTSTLLNLWSVALVAAGVVIMLSDRGFGFFMNWVSSQATSIFVTEFVMMGFFVYVNMRCGHKAAFEEKWEPFFQAQGIKGPKSITDVALKAKHDFIAEVRRNKIPILILFTISSNGIISLGTH